MNADSTQRFPIVRKGYDPEAVDIYIENLRGKNQDLQNRIEKLEERIRTAEDLIETFSKAEDNLRQDIADSKKAAASMILDAKQRAATLLDKARGECGRIVANLEGEVADRMRVLDGMKAQVTAFKDQLFQLYGSHIEMIESIANAAQSLTYEPDYSGVAEAVNAFEEAGEPAGEVPAFTEYPAEGIFPKKEEAAPAAEESIPAQEKAAEPESSEEDDFFAPAGEDTAGEVVYPFDTESVSAPPEDTDADYYQYLRDFVNGEEDSK